MLRGSRGVQRLLRPDHLKFVRCRANRRALPEAAVLASLGCGNPTALAELNAGETILVRQNMLLWVGCIAGALQDYQYVSMLANAEFENISIKPTRIYDIEDARSFLSGQGVDVDAIAPQVQGKFMSAFIRATKPMLPAAAGNDADAAQNR